MSKNRAGGIIIENDKVLLIHRIVDSAQFYVFPGGRVEDGENYEQAVVREIREELGVKSRIRKHFTDVKLDKNGLQITEKYFYIEILEGVPGLNQQDEIYKRMTDTQGKNHYELVWIPISDIDSLTIYPEQVKQRLVQEISALTPIFDNTVPFRDTSFRAIGYDTPFCRFDNNLVKQSYGIVLDDDNRLLLVKHQRGDYLLPGGGVEKGEKLIETLQRELMEEAAVTVYPESIRDGFWQKILIQKDGEWQEDTVQVRFCARVKDKLQFENDPGGLIIAQEWIEIDKLPDYLDWGEANMAIQTMAGRFAAGEI